MIQGQDSVGSCDSLGSQAPGGSARATSASRVWRIIKDYLLALLSVLLALALRWWLDPALHETLPFAFFAIPVLVIAWRVGLGPSVFAAVLGLSIGVWFFIEPRYELGVARPAGWLAVWIYSVTAGLICWCAEELRRLHSRSEAQATRLKAQRDSLAAEMEMRKGLQAALSESEQRYRAVIEAIPNLVWTASPDGSCDFASSQWEQYTGALAAEYLADRWTELVHPEDLDRVVAAWEQAVKSGEGAEFDLRLRGRDGTYRGFKTQAVPLRDAAGQVVKWFGTCTDVTELLAAQDLSARHRQELERQVRERTLEVERLRKRLEQENSYLRKRVLENHGHGRIVGQSEAIQRVLAQAEQVATTDATVLVLGETGTGKELLAEWIHALSARRDRPLVTVNCAAIPQTLVESELFGRERGAFTGSLSRQIGKFELADQSTIFLDEVGELSVEVQAKLLRVLDARQIERLGNPKPVDVNVRIIAATNRDLQQAVRDGKFREDLYYRLNVFPITVPPLRERPDDVPLLVWAFVDEYAKTFSKNIDSVERESMDALQHYSWPGNVRELRNLIERAMIVVNGPKLRIQLPAAATLAAVPHARKLDEVQRDHLLKVLEESGWRVRGVNGAAAKLGLKPTTLEARMAKLGIRRPGSLSPETGTPASDSKSVEIPGD